MVTLNTLKLNEASYDMSITKYGKAFSKETKGLSAFGIWGQEGQAENKWQGQGHGGPWGTKRKDIQDRWSGEFKADGKFRSSRSKRRHRSVRSEGH